MIVPPAKFIDLVTKVVDTTEWPLPQVDNTIPKFNYEVIKVNKQVSQILVHQLKLTPIEVDFHPKFESVIVAEKYYVNCNFESNEGEILWDSYLEQIASGQVCRPVPTPLLSLQHMPHRDFGFLEEPILEYFAGKHDNKLEPLQLKSISNNIFVPVPIILQPQPTPREPSLSVWECYDKISLFGIIEEQPDSKLPPSEPDILTLLPEQHNLVTKYSIGLSFPTIIPNKGDQLFEFDFPNWEGPNVTQHYDTHDINMFLFEREPIHSRKYMVQPIATANPKENKPAEYFLQLYLDKHYNTNLWHLNKYQLIVEMEWKPIITDIKTLQSHFLVEHLDSKIDAQLEQFATVDDIKLDPCVTENTFVLDYPQLQEQSTTTQLELDNGTTNLATYHDDTDALVKLVATKKRKLNSKVVDIPQELALLLFLRPKEKKEQVGDKQEAKDKKEAKEDISTESKIPQYSVFFDSSFSESTKEYQFPSNQYIALSQSFWNKDYTTAKSLSEKLGVIEVKFSHAVDIVINATSAIYITPADLLIQGDGKSTEFLILQELLTMKQHFHKLYIVSVANTPSFVEYAGIKLQTLQLICLAINIKLLFVSKEDILLWLLEVIELEPRQLIDEPIDLENQQYGLLCECGLTYFQAREILKMTSLEKFIASSVDEKLKKFKELVTPELLVCVCGRCHCLNFTNFNISVSLILHFWRRYAKMLSVLYLWTCVYN